MASEVGEWSPRGTSSASYHEQLKYTCWMKSWEQHRLLPKLISPLFTKSCTRAHRRTSSTCQLCNTRARKHLANELIQPTIIMRNLVICNLASWTNARDNLASHETWSQFSESPASTAVDGDAVSWHHAKVQRVINIYYNAYTLPAGKPNNTVTQPWPYLKVLQKALQHYPSWCPDIHTRTCRGYT